MSNTVIKETPEGLKELMARDWQLSLIAIFLGIVALVLSLLHFFNFFYTSLWSLFCLMCVLNGIVLFQGSLIQVMVDKELKRQGYILTETPMLRLYKKKDTLELFELFDYDVSAEFMKITLKPYKALT